MRQAQRMVHAFFVFNSFSFMRKYFFISLLTLIPLCSNATKFEVDGICYNMTGGFAVEVTNNDNGEYAGDIVIPAKVIYNSEKYNVTSIGSGAFSRCSSLTSIDIPEGVTKIGYCAFNGCI